MGRASWIPGKNLDFIPRLAGARSLWLQLESTWTLDRPGDHGPIIPILLIPSILPKMTMQGQKDADARSHPLRTLRPVTAQGQGP